MRPSTQARAPRLALAFALFLPLAAPLVGCSTEVDDTSAGSGDELAGGFADTRNLLSSVVAFVDDASAGAGRADCTATRVSVDTFLTAAHCVVASNGTLRHRMAGGYWLGFAPNDLVPWIPNPQGRDTDQPPLSQALQVVSTTLPPGELEGRGCAGTATGSVSQLLAACPWDIALVRVRQIPLATYSRISTRRVPNGTTIAVAGTGSQRGMDGNDGDLLAMRKFAYATLVATGADAPSLFYFRGLGAGGNASTAPGDSGGPSFDGRGAIVGVHSFGFWGSKPTDVSTWGADVALGNGIGPWLRSQLPASSFAD